MSHFSSPVYIGGAPVFGGNGMPITGGNVYYVNYGSGNDGNVGTSADKPLKTIDKAYEKCTSNNMDVIVLMGNSTHVLTAPIAWTKNRITVIGGDLSPRMVQQNAKIQCATTGTTSYVIKNTGVRNWFHNIKFIQASTEATALTVVEMGGEGNCYSYCSFVFGVADNLGNTAASEVVCGEDSGTFVKCTFGADTLLTSDARAVFLIDQVTANQEFKSNQFDDCLFNISSSSATAYLLKLAANTDVLFSNIFRNCDFLASVDSAGGAALTNAVTSASSTVKGCIAFKNPGVFNCTNFSANDSTAFEVQVPAVSNNAFEAVTPA